MDMTGDVASEAAGGPVEEAVGGIPGDLTSLDRARGLDAADPLRGYRDRFAVLDPALVYLDGNSLGRPPLTVLDAVRRVTTEEWPADLIRGWDRWLDMPLRVGDQLGRGVLGARDGESVAEGSQGIISVHGTGAIDPRCLGRRVARGLARHVAGGVHRGSLSAPGSGLVVPSAAFALRAG